MSNIDSQQTNMFSGIGTSVAFQGIMTGGFGSISAIRRNSGISKAFKATKQNNEVVKKAFGQMSIGDRFIKNQTMGQTYGDYINAQKQIAKLNKIQNSKMPSWLQKIFHPFTDVKNIGSEINKAEANLTNITDNFKNLSKLEITPKSFAKNLSKTFKSEFKDPFGLIFAGSEVVSRFTSQAIPAFKNEGFIAGIKETGKALLAGSATLVTDAGLSVIFRTIGATLGGFLGPLGASIGSLIGNAIGGVMSNNIVQKLLPIKEQPEASAQDTQEQISLEEPKTQSQETQAQTEAESNQDINSKYAHLPDKEQIEQMTYAQAFKGINSNVKFYA